MHAMQMLVPAPCKVGSRAAAVIDCTEHRTLHACLTRSAPHCCEVRPAVSKVKLQPRMQEAKRREAAALLERKMAAMEAVLAARRKRPPPMPDAASEPEPVAEKMLEQLKPPDKKSTGPAAGSGYELLLQACRPSYSVPRCYAKCHSSFC